MDKQGYLYSTSTSKGYGITLTPPLISGYASSEGLHGQLTWIRDHRAAALYWMKSLTESLVKPLMAGSANQGKMVGRT